MLPLLLGAGRVLAGGTMRGMAARKIASSALQKNKPETQSGAGSEEKDSKSTKKISSIKLLSGRSETARGGALVKASSAKIKAESFKKQGETISFSKDQFLVVETQVIKIRDLVISGGALRQSQAAQERKDAEKKSRESREKSLETDKTPKDDSGIKVPPGPKLGFFERIKQFLFKMLVGWIVVRLMPYVPQMINFIKMATPAIDWVMNTAGFLLNGLVTFVDWGVKAVDGARGLAKKIGGDKTLELFDKFTSVFTTLVNGALILSMILLKSKGAAQTAGKVAGGAGKLLSNIGGKLTGGIIKGGVTKSATRLGIAVAGKAGGKVVKGLSKALSKIPVIGGLIDFGINLLLGEPVGRAAAKAAGATAGGALGGIVAGAIGSVVPFAGTAIGGVVGSTLGSFLGDWAGGALYDAFAGAKKQTQKMAGGGITRGGKTVGGGVSRGGRDSGKRKRKISRTISTRKTEIKPGTSTGGEDKIQRIFPKRPDPKVISPLDYIKRTYDQTADARYFGPMFGLAIKTLAGNKPQSIDYKNAASGINSWLYQTFNTEVLGTSTGAFAGGGEVNSEMFMRNEDMTRAISKSLEDNVKEKVDKAIQDLRRQLGLKDPAPPPGTANPKEGDPDSLNIEDGGIVTGGNADFWTLVAIASREDGDPQGWADVAQSIYNRVASGVYGGKTIKEIVTRQGQYEPTWKFPNGPRNGVGKPNPEWLAIKDAESASRATGQSVAAMNSVAAAIRNKKYQDEAAKFIGGRTDFMGGGNKMGPGDIRRSENSPNNFFGWFVGPAAIAYGKKNPGPAKAPQLGDIVVHAGAGGNVAVKGGKAFPLPKGRVGTSSGQVYGAPRSYGGHAGVDVVEKTPYAADPKLPVVAYAGGKVISEKYQTSGYTAGLMIDHGGVQTRYLHTTPSVSPGTTIQPGQRVGKLLDLGNQTHLHFEAYQGSKRLNPTSMLNAVAHKGMPRVNRNELIAKLLKDEAVLDVDTSQALRKINPLLISRLNKASTVGEIMKVLREYASYEPGAPQEVEVPEPQIISLYQSINVNNGGGAFVVGTGGGDDFSESLAAGQ